jgi:hypothetical protein
MTAKEAAEKWGITKRRVQILCSEKRVIGAQKLGNMWVMPRDATKPSDGRIRRHKGIL